MNLLINGFLDYKRTTIVVYTLLFLNYFKSIIKVFSITFI